MIIEYAQLLSTAHRLLDGKQTEIKWPSGKSQRLNLLPSETFSLQTRLTANGKSLVKYYIDNPVCYNLTHANHPSAIWARQSSSNYRWLYSLFIELSLEYTFRYGKHHKTFASLATFLGRVPTNTPIGPQTTFAQAMPEEFKDINDSILAYQNYYLGPKASFAKWTNRSTPIWFQERYKDFYAPNFERTTTLA